MRRENHLKMIRMSLSRILLNPELSAWTRKYDRLIDDEVPRDDEVSQG